LFHIPVIVSLSFRARKAIVTSLNPLSSCDSEILNPSLDHQQQNWQRHVVNDVGNNGVVQVVTDSALFGGKGVPSRSW
jgi:hypothetical protein